MTVVDLGSHNLRDVVLSQQGTLFVGDLDCGAWRAGDLHAHVSALVEAAQVVQIV